MPPEVKPLFEVGDIFQTSGNYQKDTFKGIITEVIAYKHIDFKYKVKWLSKEKPQGGNYFDHNSPFGKNAKLITKSKASKLLYGTSK